MLGTFGMNETPKEVEVLLLWIASTSMDIVSSPSTVGRSEVALRGDRASAPCGGAGIDGDVTDPEGDCTRSFLDRED